MQMCPNCDRVYDESEYGRCPYCSGELEDENIGRPFRACPNCNGIMFYDDWDKCWQCTNCDEEDDSDEDDYNGIIED